MEEKLNLVKYLHLILRQVELMVFGEHLHEVGIHLFCFGHLWHASRALFQDLTTGVTIDQLEYGRNEKLS